MNAQTSSKIITLDQTLTNAYVLAENQLGDIPNSDDKWFQLYGESQATLEVSYTTGSGETDNYVEFYLEYGTGAPTAISWAEETVEYFDDSSNQIVLEKYTYRLDGATADTTYTRRIQLPLCTKGVRIYIKEVGVASNYGTITIRGNSQSAGVSSYNRWLQTVSLALGTSVQIGDGSGNTAAILERTTGSEIPAVTDDALVVYDVGGGVASVGSEYRATTAGQDGTVVYASGTTLTVTNTPFTLNSEDLVYIREVDETGNTANIWVNGSGGVHMEISGSTITRSGGSDFSATGVYEVGYNGQDKAYDSSTDSDKVFNIADLATQVLQESIVDTTNISASTHYYPASTGKSNSGYKNGSISGKFIDADGTVTLTLEVTNDEDLSSADWNGVYFYDDNSNATVNSLSVTNGTLLISASINNNSFSNYRWVVTTSGATNTIILKENRTAL